jgi:hypothetical protein
MLSSLSVALQGVAPFPLSALTIAVQGFIEALQDPLYAWDTSQGMAPVNMRGYIDRINREYNHTNRLALDDRAATEFIMALVHSEILYGEVQQ